MSSIVQRSYSPYMPKGTPGMVCDETPSAVLTRIVETAAGIAFGVAVSVGTGVKGAVIGGAKFLGISVRDITFSAGTQIDPSLTAAATVDAYPKAANMGVLTRGHIWVRAHSNVAENDAVYYEQTNGTLSASASGTGASGQVEFTTQPSDGDTISFAADTSSDGTTSVTFKDGDAAGADEVNIGATLAETITALAVLLNASVDANLASFDYGADAHVLYYSAHAVGVAGNAMVVTTDVTGATVTAMAGGTASATAVPYAYWLDTALAGQLARVSLAVQR